MQDAFAALTPEIVQVFEAVHEVTVPCLFSAVIVTVTTTLWLLSIGVLTSQVEVNELAIGYLSKIEASRKVTATVRQAAESQVTLTPASWDAPRPQAQGRARPGAAPHGGRHPLTARAGGA